jgi:hypothetical protein
MSIAPDCFDGKLDLCIARRLLGEGGSVSLIDSLPVRVRPDITPIKALSSSSFSYGSRQF